MACTDGRMQVENTAFDRESAPWSTRTGRKRQARASELAVEVIAVMLRPALRTERV